MPLTAPCTSSGPTSRATSLKAAQSSASSRSSPSCDTTTIIPRSCLARVAPVDVKEAGEVFVTPSAFADDARFHEACALLRREDPIHLVEHADYPPFHVLTKHADVLDVELHPAAWTNAPLPVLATKEAVALQEAQGTQLLRTLIHLDGEEHKAYRNITVDWFTPKALVGLEPRLAQLAKDSVDR